MMITTRTNHAAHQALNDIRKTSRRQTEAFDRLASGYRVTKASDDVAALSVGTELTAQVQSLQQATRNARQGLSALETVEGALASGQELLTRLRELTIQHLGDGLSRADRKVIAVEMNQVLEELDRISETAEFNGLKLLNGALSSFDVQIGLRDTQADFMSLKLVDAGLTTLGINYDNFFGYYEIHTDNVGSGTERASHALQYNTLGADQNKLQARTDSTLANNFQAQNITVQAPDGSTQSHSIAANDTAHEIAAALDGFQGVTATARAGPH